MRKILKNKKGFTLTELLLVIVVLLAITSTSVFGVQKIQRESAKKRLDEIVDEIELAADIYLNRHPVYQETLLNNPTSSHCTRVYTLQSEGLLDIDLENPVTNRRIPGNLCVYATVDENGVIVNNFNYE